MIEGQSGRSNWLEFRLHELAAVLGPEGHRAVLYCGACETEISYEEAAAGPIRDWPYCPVHQDRPLMICSTALRFAFPRMEASQQVSMADIPLETKPAMQYSSRPRAAER
jgi:hypothetical protein